MDFKEWDSFNKQGEWTKEIDVRSFIQANYIPYEGNSSFLTTLFSSFWHLPIAYNKYGNP